MPSLSLSSSTLKFSRIHTSLCASILCISAFLIFDCHLLSSFGMVSQNLVLQIDMAICKTVYLAMIAVAHAFQLPCPCQLHRASASAPRAAIEHCSHGQPRPSDMRLCRYWCCLCHADRLKQINFEHANII